MSNLERLKRAGVDVSKLAKRPHWMRVERYEDLSYLFHTCEYDFDRFERRVNEINRTAHVIEVCRRCGKVDINLMSHWRNCDPIGEQYRRESQEVYWK